MLACVIHAIALQALSLLQLSASHSLVESVQFAVSKVAKCYLAELRDEADAEGDRDAYNRLHSIAAHAEAAARTRLEEEIARQQCEGDKYEERPGRQCNCSYDCGFNTMCTRLYESNGRLQCSRDGADEKLFNGRMIAILVPLGELHTPKPGNIDPPTHIQHPLCCVQTRSLSFAVSTSARWATRSVEAHRRIQRRC